MGYDFDRERLIYRPFRDEGVSVGSVYDVRTCLKLTAEGVSWNEEGPDYLRPSVVDRAKAARGLREFEKLVMVTDEQASVFFDSVFLPTR
jgi:hypothetical protein